MRAMRSTRRHWTDWYPVETELLANASADDQGVLLVDVGGGEGHDIERFFEKASHLSHTRRALILTKRCFRGSSILHSFRFA